MKTEKKAQKETEETKSRRNLSRFFRFLRFLLSDAFSSISDYQRRLAVPPRFSCSPFPLSRFPAFRLSAPAGFTLIEIVGVMAVLAILAAAIVPVAVRQSDKGALTKESSYVSSISNALAMQIIRNKVIPDETTWSTVAANWMMLPASQISTNSRGFARAFVIDAGGWLVTNSVSSPYTQPQPPAFTYPRPAGARAMIVSTIARDLPITSGQLATASFNDIWNTPPLAKPSTWTWNGSGGDLTIQRFSVDSLFHRLILANRDDSTQPAFSIDSINPLSTLAVAHNGAGWDSYYLDGTVVSLWVGPTLTNSFVLTSDISFTFNGGMWRAQLAGGAADNGGLATNFGAWATAFINTPSSNQKGTDPQGVMTGFASFMYAYTIWANECPHFLTSASGYPNTADVVILNSIEGLLDKATGYNDSSGLLK